MTLDQLRIFLAVAEHGHVTRAARSLGMTQSAVSAAISALENRYGTRLFDRVGRGIELTETGRRFVPEARAVIDRASEARSALEDLSNLASGTVSIAASQTIATYWLPRRITSYHLEHPGIRLNVVIGNTREVERAVVGGTADIGLVEGPTGHPALVRRTVDRDHLVLVVAPGQDRIPRTSQGDIDIRGFSWVVREAGSGTRQALEDEAERRGLKFEDLRVFLVLPSNEAVREAVEAGAGATIISEHVVAAAIRAKRLRALPVDLPPRDFVLLRHSERQPGAAARALIDVFTATKPQRLAS
ncbi:LysR family transcriptional regulator [Microbaculum marinum]|uniref:LysR family transcriptional regulator n=1 Tax=Microbaculum marinum TaxID=1764581 RepID=A0AAW9RXA8_9HYPH